MRSFILRRLATSVPVVLGVVTLVFALIHLVPGDPVDAMLGESALPAQREELRHALGLDRPILVQYAHFLGGLVRGDLGTSFRRATPVTALLAQRYPATAQLTLAAMAVATLVALPLGVLAALRARTWIDHGSSAAALFGVSVPNFWLGPMLILVFAIRLDWLPVSGRDGLANLVLPAITLGLGLAGILTRMTRSSLLETLGEDYIRTAKAKGLGPAVIVWKHAMRNALIPIVTLMALQFGALLAGSVITETIFSWPGVGKLLLEGIRTRDYPVVQGVVLSIALTYVAVNLLTDLLYAWVNPSIRFGGRS
ncbi:MAG: ABC transporter permease [Deltaproteobacteria bacterium]|nr:ABC transporter permease [Deltaproteobacteria bacterium]